MPPTEPPSLGMTPAIRLGRVTDSTEPPQGPSKSHLQLVPTERDLPVVGTDTLGRRLTVEEKRYFERLLRKHGFVQARLAALKFAHRKTGNVEKAKDVLGRALERLVKQGWDPAEVPLKKRLMRLVWSEFTHEAAERRLQRNAEGRYAHEMRDHIREHALSAEDRHLLEADRRRERMEAEVGLIELKAEFQKRGDTVNLEWLACREEGITTVDDMARKCRREPREFYLAAERRRRMLSRLLAEKRGIRVVEEP